MAEIVLINPRFEVSYWGLEHALPLAVRRCSAGDRPVLTANEQRSRPGVAPDLSPSDGHQGPPTAGSELVVHLRDQVRHALSPLHNVAPDGRTAEAGEHVLAARASTAPRLTRAVLVPVIERMSSCR